MSTDSPADLRQDALRRWLVTVLGACEFALAPASSDASFRRYFRARLFAPADLAPGATTLIAMDAPPPREDCRPFVKVAKLLEAAGVHSPHVFAADFDRGFLLLSDLGTTTYAAALTQANAATLYLDAIGALVHWQRATRAGELPPYDDALLRRELDLFPAWYMARHLEHPPTAVEHAALAGVFAALIANNLAQPRVYVHRDYHSRNLMVCAPNPGVLDFQDAVCGPVTYDLVSLLRDAYVEWDEDRELDWVIRYWERARDARLPVAAGFADFWRDYEWMGVQRQLKVLGIFARLNYRDGKRRYLEDMPRVMRYLRRASARYRELDPLTSILDALEMT